MKTKKKIYFASDLGFTECGKSYMPIISEKLQNLGFIVLNPWENEYETEIQQGKINIKNEYDFAMFIGKKNKESIEQSDEIFAILDGPDVDSGTAAEIGYAFGLGKKINGLRTDKRESGEPLGVLINLQVEYFIKASGGKIFKKLEDINI